MANKSMEDKRPTCFVMMPISDVPGYEPGHFGRVYEHLLKPAIIASGYDPVRADDAVKTDYIVVGIIQKIVESEMVLCDISGRNPNVLYELGIRHAFNKPVVLVKDKITERIFDIQGLRSTEYNESLRIDAVTKDKLRITEAISETASSTAKDTNSIVHLAGIKTAEPPAVQTISPDTELILSAINNLRRKVNDVEIPDREFYFTNASTVAANDGLARFSIGRELFREEKKVGVVTGVDLLKRRITVAEVDGGVYVYKYPHPFFAGLDPF